MRFFKPRPLVRATLELANAANGVRPLAREGYLTLPVFAFGWPTSEMSPLYMAGSMLDAVRRGVRGDFRGPRGRIAFGLTAFSWALLYLIHRRNVAAQPHFEDPLQEALGEALEGRTAVVIAHRLSTIRAADLILVIEDGRIVERGNHTELLGRGGRYAQLYRTQFATATPVLTEVLT